MADRITIDLATEADRQEIYRLRHQVYASELHQHQENSDACLSDSLDAHNSYLKASVARAIGRIRQHHFSWRPELLGR